MISNQVKWKRAGEEWHLCMNSGRLLAQVIPDAIYGNMWRISVRCGPLSGMVNLSRAKDAAITQVDRILRMTESPKKAPPIRQNEKSDACPMGGAAE
jgi:hypothetical protein